MSNFKNDLIKFTKTVGWQRKSCTLKVKSNSDVGYLYYKNGALIEVETDTLRGEQAILNILKWVDVTNELVFGCKYDTKKDNGTSFSTLILNEQKSIFYKNDIKQREILNNKKEGGVAMVTVWDAILKAKDQQEEKNIIHEEKSVKLKEISNESTNSISEKQENGTKMEDSKEEKRDLNSNEEVSRIDRLNKVLSDLKKISYDIIACAVASEDGLIMASNLPEGLEESNVAAMCSVMLSMGERVSAELKCGTAGQLFIKGDDGYIVAMSAGSGAVLLVMAKKEAKLGLVFLDLSRASEKVEQALS